VIPPELVMDAGVIEDTAGTTALVAAAPLMTLALAAAAAWTWAETVWRCLLRLRSIALAPNDATTSTPGGGGALATAAAWALRGTAVLAAFCDRTTWMIKSATMTAPTICIFIKHLLVSW
jgi:hypothetical protein